MCRESFECATCLVRHGNDTLGSLRFSIATLQLGFENTECNRGLGRSARFRDHNNGQLTILNGVEQFVGVIFANVLTCKENDRIFAVAFEQRERVAHSLQDGLCAQVRATDTDTYDHFGLCTQTVGSLFDCCELLGVDRRGERNPTQKVVTCALATCQQSIRTLGSCTQFCANRNGSL